MTQAEMKAEYLRRLAASNKVEVHFACGDPACRTCAGYFLPRPVRPERYQVTGTKCRLEECDNFASLVGEGFCLPHWNNLCSWSKAS